MSNPICPECGRAGWLEDNERWVCDRCGTDWDA